MRRTLSSTMRRLLTAFGLTLVLVALSVSGGPSERPGGPYPATG